MLTKTPEQEELERKNQELESLENDLLEKELEFATLNAELNNFQAQFEQRMLPLYSEIDELRAAIAELEAIIDPTSNNKQVEARAQREHAKETSSGASSFLPNDCVTFIPSADLKRLFREIAKKLHPDLTDSTDPNNLLKRTQLMAEVNEAYSKGDKDRMLRILEEWDSSPEGIEGEGEGLDLIRVIRKIAQLKRRIEMKEMELSALMATSQAQLMQALRISDPEQQFDDLVEELESEIEMLKEHLHHKSGRKIVVNNGR